MKNIAEDYPCGPCVYPCKCECGTVVTRENAKYDPCDHECEVCDYCSTGKCPNCGEHTCCGGCI